MAPPQSLQAWPSLTSEQQRLLLTALTTGRNSTSSAYHSHPSLDANTSPESTTDTTALPPEAFSKSDLTHSALSGMDDPLTDFQFQGADQNSQASSSSDVNPFDSEFGNKRKALDDEDDDEDDFNDAKRADTSDDKVAKKPGRKPITTEPTTKRKAQNRAAQRAFRERKEKHLKDLETKVKELEQASSAASEENSLLKAQVTKLQSELKEYRKRMSLNAGGSPPRASSDQSSLFSTGFSDFNFDFTKFGTQYNDLTSKVSVPRQQSRSSLSPHTSASPSTLNGSSPPMFHNTSVSSNTSVSGGGNNAGSNSIYGFFDINTNPFGFAEGKSPESQPRHFYNRTGSSNTPASQQQNKHRSSIETGSAPSSAASPCDSQKAATCSSCTSPGMDEFSSPSKLGETIDFPKDHSLGNWPTPQSRNMTLDPGSTTTSDLASFDWLANQNGGSFDPVLFGSYRESQDAVVGDGEFSGGFFDETTAFGDFTDPFAAGGLFSETQSPPIQQKQPSLLEQVEKQREGIEYDQPVTVMNTQMPSEAQMKQPGEMWTAHKVWNTLQTCPQFQAGEFDLDSLCSELKAKAKCSETGMSIPEKDVKAALWRLAGKNESQSTPGI